MHHRKGARSRPARNPAALATTQNPEHPQHRQLAQNPGGGDSDAGCDLRRWQGLCRFGAVAAAVNAVLLPAEVVVYATLPRSSTALEHFTLFQDNALAGLLTLDLLGMISYLLFIPMMLALYVVLRRSSESVMAVSTVLFFVGIADFFATNNALSVLHLSNLYATAASEAERTMYLTAGQTLLTVFNENAFLVSYAFVSLSWALIGVVMLRSGLCRHTTAWAGILAGTAGVIAVILEHVPVAQAQMIPIAIGFYFAAIVFLFAWVAGTGRHLWRLGRPLRSSPVPPAAAGPSVTS